MVWIEGDDTDTSAEMDVSPEPFVLLGQGFDDRLILGIDAAYHRLRIDGSGRCDERDVDMVLGQQAAERRQETNGRMRRMNLDQGQGFAELEAIDGKLFGHIEDQPLSWPIVGKRRCRRPIRMPLCADDQAGKFRAHGLSRRQPRSEGLPAKTNPWPAEPSNRRTEETRPDRIQ